MGERYRMVCSEKEVADGAIVTVRIDGKSILLARHQGEIYALDDVCSHDEGQLGDGDLVDGQIQCPRHGARFDLKTGGATRMPAIVGIGIYKVKVENGEVYVAATD